MVFFGSLGHGNIVSFLFVLILSMETSSSNAGKESSCYGQASCGNCLAASPECTWCSDPDYSNPSQRCSNAQRGCNTTFIVNPRSSSSSAQEGDNSKTNNQLTPKKIEVKLRPGDSKVIDLTFTKNKDYPLDLYYVMDLSFSMGDDLEKLKELGQHLAENLENVTKNVHLGFGSFVDKTVMPFTSTTPEHLKQPCDKETCGPAFGYNHQLKLTKEKNKFAKVINETQISGNIDAPEGGFDALMQIAVCQKLIGWRQDALRVILYASDASPHIALDGKLAAILDPNDKNCHLQKDANPNLLNQIVYSKTKTLDYPSVGQLRDAFIENKIKVIFAVTKEVLELYTDLVKIMHNSEAKLLKGDSSNVVEIIKDAYNKLKKRISINVPKVPKNVELKYRVQCPDSEWKNNTLECDSVEVGELVRYQFELKALKCPEPRHTSHDFEVSSSFAPLATKIELQYLCMCDCEDVTERKSDHCTAHGNLQCGMCTCSGQYSGSKCQCENVSTDDSRIEGCVQNSPLFPNKKNEFCSGHGACECGECICQKGHSGSFCQCTDGGCPSTKDGVCGGPENGDCHNCNNDKNCICKNGFTKDPMTKTCTCHEIFCKANATETTLCSNHGNCDCNACHCEGGMYQGQYCEECIHPMCKGIDYTCASEDFLRCARCLSETQNHNKNLGKYCAQDCDGISYKIADNLQECPSTCTDSKSPGCSGCKDISPEFSSSCIDELINYSCRLFYHIIWDTKAYDFVLVVQKLNQERDCVQPIDPVRIVLFTVSGILFIGIVLLCIWKAVTHYRDRREFEHFIQEQKKSKWNTESNPLFKEATTRIQNPTFQKNI